MSTIDCFEGYLAKVFKLPQVISGFKDLRTDPSIDIRDIFMGYLYASAFRIKATSSIEEETKKGGVLEKRVGFISDDSFGFGLNHLTIRSLRNGWNQLVRIIKRNGMLRDNNPFDDYIVGVLDGIETCNSYNRHCRRCLTREIKTKKGTRIQYYHRSVVLIVVGYDFPIPIGLEMQREGEDEITCALRLLQRIVRDLGVRFLDIVIGDAAYCTPRFFAQCDCLGICPGAVLKNNQQNLLDTARAMKKNIKPVLKNSADEKLVLWDMGDVTWDTADRDVRVIWADRKVWEKDEESNDSSFHWVDKLRVFAFSKQLDQLSSKIVYDIGIHRWDIDAKMFQDIVKNWLLKHKTLHFERAYENMLSIRFIAYMLFMCFFVRHINSRRKNKIQGYITMAKMLYRSACRCMASQFIFCD